MMLSGCGGGFGVSGCIAAGVDISALSLLAGGASMAAAFPAMSVAALLSASFRLDIPASADGGCAAAPGIGAPDFAAASRACLISS